jgi:hypothetical protein
MMFSRRTVLRSASLAACLPAARAACAGRAVAAGVPYTLRALTSGPRHHFFGYYGITPWNQSGKYLISLESAFQDHLPRPDEAAAIGLVDAATGAFNKVAETRAWNFQQGAMMHWDPSSPETGILFNERRGEDIISVALDVRSGQRRELPRAISAVSHNGRWALSLTYGRLARLRPVVGYVGARDPNPANPAPDSDGIFRTDLASGKTRLIVPIAEVYARLLQAHPEIKPRHMWFNHVLFNRNDTRFLFFARVWSVPEEEKKQLESAMFTANVDGSELRQVIPFGRISHYDWLDDRRILATFQMKKGEEKYYLFTDGQGDYRSFGDDFFRGGHPTFSPDGNWIATDAGDGKKKEKLLILYSMKTGEGQVLGSFPMREYMSGDLRCDLHPRWNRAGNAICFDALETKGWTRQLHVAQLEL